MYANETPRGADGHTNGRRIEGEAGDGAGDGLEDGDDDADEPAGSVDRCF